MKDRIDIDGNAIPEFPAIAVSGHSNRIAFGQIADVPVLVFCGRKHLYEKVDVSQVVYPIACLCALGAEGVVLTNAAGAVNPDFQIGQLMLVRDHIDTSFGRFAEELQRTVSGLRDGIALKGDSPYDSDWLAIARQAARDSDPPVCEGVYCFNRGPFYETPAEVRACRSWGADAVGMSTVPEALCAWQLGMKVLAVSCLTNMATGLARTAHCHEEVKKQAAESGRRMGDLLREFFEALPTA